MCNSPVSGVRFLSEANTRRYPPLGMETAGKVHFAKSAAVIREVPAIKINGERAGIVQLDPVGAIAILIRQAGAIGRQEFADHHLPADRSLLPSQQTPSTGRETWRAMSFQSKINCYMIHGATDGGTTIIHLKT